MKKLILTLSLLLFLLTISPIYADSCDDIPATPDKIQDKIACLEKKTTELANQSKTLSNQIAQFNSKILVTELKVQQTQDKIDLLSGRIDQLDVSLKDLTKAFSNRALATYKMARSDEAFFLLLSAQNLGELSDKFHYLQKIQLMDRDFMIRLTYAQNTYKQDKSNQEELEKELQQEKNDLNIQKRSKAQLLISTQNDEKKYQSLLSQAVAQKKAFQNFVINNGGASILSNQTVCNDWGCYYNQRDSEWGNRGLGISSLSMAQYGCLVSSSAMVATHYKKNIKPSDIAANPDAFFSPDHDTALLWKDVTINGVRILRTSIGVSTANIDSELASGRPVIVGLYSGPAHFIVLKSGSNGNYVMNDPFVENGHDIAFTSKYSVGYITEVETVSVQ